MSQNASSREQHFLRLWKMCRSGTLPDPVQQHVFAPPRKYRFDFAWPDHRIGVEIQGGTFSRGKSGHTSGIGIQRDCEKGNIAVLKGWRLLKYTTKDLQERPVQVVDEILSLLEITDAP